MWLVKDDIQILSKGKMTPAKHQQKFQLSNVIYGFNIDQKKFLFCSIGACLSIMIF
jgi:hypothetical protein